MRDRLIQIIREELEHSIRDGVQVPADVATRIADRLLDGHTMLRSGRRIYDRLRERLIHNLRSWNS